MTTLLVNYWRQVEDARHNLATEKEAIRHNMNQESIGYGNIGLGYAQLNEALRHNKVMETRVESQNLRDQSAIWKDQQDVAARAEELGIKRINAAADAFNDTLRNFTSIFVKKKDNNNNSRGSGGKGTTAKQRDTIPEFSTQYDPGAMDGIFADSGLYGDIPSPKNNILGLFSNLILPTTGSMIPIFG